MQATRHALDVGFAPMDDDHRALEQCIARAQASPDAGLHAAIADITGVLATHFAQEDGWMTQSAFPPRDCHIAEHAAVIGSAGEVLTLVAAGRAEVGRRFIDELAAWLPAHVTHLDSALAAWLSKQRFGGKPIVLHRARATTD